MRPADDVVVLRGVRKRYARGGPWVLAGVDLTLRSGSGVVIVGSNGSGKSTLLRLIAGLTIPTAGEMQAHPESMAYAPERLSGNIRMSARQYLAHMGALRRLAPDLIAQRTSELARRFGLLPGLDAPIRSLSKGNSQKVALIQAFLAPVEVLVLDEPFGGLDVQARETLSALVAMSIHSGSAVVVSSHAPIDVHADTRTLQIRDGLLTELAASSAGRSVNIRLARAGPDASLDDLRTAPGIIAVREEAGDEVSLVVGVARSDEILRAALSRGWSVRAVNPSDAYDNRHGS